MQRMAFPLLCLALVACTKQGELSVVDPRVSTIHINEVFAVGSFDEDELEGTGDWLELFNAGPTVHLGTGEWFLTDERDDLLKFELSDITLHERELLRVWCDGLGSEDGDGIHASFRLANQGEWLALVHVMNGKASIIDSVRYAQQDVEDELSTSRYPDGGRTWLNSTLPTPGGSNEVSAKIQ